MVNNILRGFLILILATGFLFFVYASWDLLWQNKGNGTLVEETFLLFMILSLVILFTIASVVCKKIISNEEIKINFFTFLPVLFYGLIYSYFAFS